jgi:hypothetical protein
MRWYPYDTDVNRFDAVHLVMKGKERVLDLHFESRSVARTWKPVTVEGFDDNPGVEGDFPSLNDFSEIPIFSQRAWDALHPLIGYCCEALPIRHPSRKPYYIINVMEIIDCLDEERSELTRNDVTGRVNDVIRYAFKTKLLEGKRIFKTPLKSGAGLFFDEEFCGIVKTNKLRGLLLKQLPMIR